MAGVAKDFLAVAQRHVAQGEERVERQKQIVAGLERDHHPAAAERARVVLATLAQTLALMRSHLAALRDRSDCRG